jgi:methenyltetrahydrofolate cyclohydrolase
MHETDEERFGEIPLRAFVERLASGEPVPGGGSASAVAASLGAALVAMVAALSENRPRYADHAALHEESRRLGQSLAGRLLELADEDAAAYCAFASALKLPRESPDDAAARQAAMRSAAKIAAEVPLECVEVCLQVVAAAEALAGRSNRNAASDLNVAALLAEAAARGAGANVLVNLPSLDPSDPFVGEATARVEAVLQEIGRLAELTRATVLSRVARAPVQRRDAAVVGEPG